MCRNALAGLLIFSWIILSGFDLIADLNLPNPGQYDDPADAPTRSEPFAALLASDIVESADHQSTGYATVLERFTAPTTPFAPDLPQKISKLHKLLHIFII